MSKLKVDERLTRLTISGPCPQEDAQKYAVELKQLADTVARVDEAENRSKVFKALADPTRLRILKLLEVREMCVCEVMIALGLTQPTASHHLGIMENVSLIKSRKKGKWVYYSITDLELVKNMEKLNLI